MFIDSLCNNFTYVTFEPILWHIQAKVEELEELNHHDKVKDDVKITKKCIYCKNKSMSITNRGSRPHQETRT